MLPNIGSRQTTISNVIPETILLGRQKQAAARELKGVIEYTSPDTGKPIMTRIATIGAMSRK